MADIIAKFRKGRIAINLVQGSYQGKPTYSYTINKSILKDGKWTSSDFFTISDLQDLALALNMAMIKYVKFEKVEPKPQEELQSQDEEVPF